MNPTQNYNVYRTHLKSCAPPMLPYLGQYLTDLTFIHEGNPDTNDKGLINFHKRTLMYKVISEMELFQLGSGEYKFKEVDGYICHNIDQMKSGDQKELDEKLWNESLEREPRKTENKKMLL